MPVSSSIPHGPLASAAERLMRLRDVEHNVQERVGRQPADERAGPCRSFVCLSREAAAGGEEVAAGVAQALGWLLLDYNLLRGLAELEHISPQELRFVDESRWSWLGEMFATWDQEGLSQGAYVMRLHEFIRRTVQQVPAVIVGRGAQHMLPRECGLAVRIIAPREQRIERTMREHGCDRARAAAQIDERDAERDEFVQRYFHHSTADPHLYDLVINTGSIEPKAAADLIVAECRRRFR